MNIIKSLAVGMLMVLSIASQADVVVKDAWIRAVPAVVQNTGAYFELVNRETKSVYLLGAETEMVMKAEFHNHKMVNGMMKMGREPLPIEIKSGESLILKPKGKHLMLMGIKGELKLGDEHLIQLKFQEIESIQFSAKVLLEAN